MNPEFSKQNNIKQCVVFTLLQSELPAWLRMSSLVVSSAMYYRSS